MDTFAWSNINVTAVIKTIIINITITADETYMLCCFLETWFVIRIKMHLLMFFFYSPSPPAAKIWACVDTCSNCPGLGYSDGQKVLKTRLDSVQTVSINIFEESSAFLCGYHFSSCISGLFANSFDKHIRQLSLFVCGYYFNFFFCWGGYDLSNISVREYVIIAFLLPFWLDVIS